MEAQSTHSYKAYTLFLTSQALCPLALDHVSAFQTVSFAFPPRPDVFRTNFEVF
jgi:hypothetical protein